MSLPWDYTFCLNDRCPLKEQCARWTDRPRSTAQYISVARFEPDEKGCEMYIEKAVKRETSHTTEVVGQKGKDEETNG